jgi:hypothetical protein
MQRKFRLFLRVAVGSGASDLASAPIGRRSLRRTRRMSDRDAAQGQVFRLKDGTDEAS